VKIDDRDNVRSGFKFAEWELKGVPVRLAIGRRDMAAGMVEVARRDTLEKTSVAREGIAAYIQNLLDEIQENIYQKALKFREEHTYKVDTWEEFKEKIEEGGFILAHWDGTPETEERIKEETKATIRCVPLEADEESLQPGFDMVTGKPSARRVLFARAY
jgi:prolyl-tRNA synthetase